VLFPSGGFIPSVDSAGFEKPPKTTFFFFVYIFIINHPHAKKKKKSKSS
jgi:hypothetical protein